MFKVHIRFLNRPEFIQYYASKDKAYAVLNLFHSHALVTYSKLSVELRAVA